MIEFLGVYYSPKWDEIVLVETKNGARYLEYNVEIHAVVLGYGRNKAFLKCEGFIRIGDL